MSFASRAIELLRRLPDGAETTSTVLAEQLDSDSTTIGACLAPYVRSGVVAVRKEGRRCFFSIGSGTPAAGADEDDEPPQRKAPDDAKPNLAGASIFATAAAVPHPTTWASPAKAAKRKARKAPKTEFKPKRGKAAKRPPATRLIPVTPHRKVNVIAVPQAEPAIGVALFNTGELMLEPPGAAPLRLSRAQTQALIAHLLQLDQLARPIAERIAP